MLTWQFGGGRKVCQASANSRSVEAGRQTLSHVLNHCKAALELPRYNTRHDQSDCRLCKRPPPRVFWDSCRPPSLVPRLLRDLHYNFPPMITPTDLRPDIVIWSQTLRSATLVELTVCYETNYVQACDLYFLITWQEIVMSLQGILMVTLNVMKQQFLIPSRFVCLFTIPWRDAPHARSNLTQNVCISTVELKL